MVAVVGCGGTEVREPVSALLEKLANVHPRAATRGGTCRAEQNWLRPRFRPRIFSPGGKNVEDDVAITDETGTRSN